MNRRKLLCATALLTGSLLACADEEPAYGNPKGCFYDDGGYDDCEPDAAFPDALGDAGADAGTDARGLDPDARIDAVPDAIRTEDSAPAKRTSQRK